MGRVDLTQMNEFMNYDVIHQTRRKLKDLPIEIENSVLTACAPAKPQITDLNPFGTTRGTAGKRRRSPFYPIRSGSNIPTPEVLLCRAGILAG